jgi:hypothetical protein
MSDKFGCVIGAGLLALGAFFMLAEIGKALTWMKWGFQ